MKSFSLFLAACTLLLTSCVSKKVHDELWVEQIDCKNHLSEARKELVTLKGQNKLLQEKTREVELRNEELSKTNQILVTKNQTYANQQLENQSKILELKKEKAETEEKLVFTSKTYDDLIQTLKEEIKEGQIRIGQKGDRLTVNVSNQILFHSGSAQVQAKGKSVLKKVVKALKKMKDKRILVEGHTDNLPITQSLKKKFPSNWDLSTARATQVVRFLEEQGINPERLTASGRGEYAPIASNQTREGRKQNRRIEIILLPLLPKE